MFKVTSLGVWAFAAATPLWENGALWEAPRMSETQMQDRLRIQVERMADVAVVHCQGELVSSVTDVLYRAVKELIPEVKRIVLDLRELSYLDSSGIGMIVRLFVSAKAAKCSLELANISGRVRQILGITDLLSVLQVIGENNIRM
jgi:anti-anti-sigma factor